MVRHPGIDRDDLGPSAVRRWAASSPDVVFLQHVDGRRLTYGDVDDAIDHWATGFAGLGLAPGDRIASFLTDPIDAAVVWLAIGRAGFVATPLNTAHIGQMLRHVLAVSAAAAIVVSPDLVGRLDDVIDDLPALLTVVVVGGADGIERASSGTRSMTSDELLAVEPRRDFAGPEVQDTAMLLFTSGTTGPSKAVVVPWAAAHGYWSWVPEDTLHADEGLYAPMTMFHISGLGALQYAAWRGGRLILRDRFSAQSFWADTRATGAVAVGVVGPMTALLASAPPRADDADNPVRGVILGPMIPEVEAFEQRFGVKVATCYGMTEVPPIVATGWDHGPWETCGALVEGYPWPEARLVDGNDNEVPDGDVGELIVRTGAPWTLNGGYFGDAEATVTAWRNGWFHTGDAFRRDADGWYYFVDRMTDTIRRRGENISSFEVEHAVLQHRAVEACAAYGVPDTFGGGEVMVAVVPKGGAVLDSAELVNFLGGQLPTYMVPRYVDVVDELPRNTTSLRVQKFVLRERGVTATTWDREATRKRRPA